MNFIGHLISQYWHLAFFGLILIGVLLGFIRNFWKPARGLAFSLEVSIRELEAIRSQRQGDVVDLDEIASKAMEVAGLRHLWNEYTETLHPQKGEDEAGQLRVVRWRATAVADTFFTDQAVVDTRLKTEFYKHMPGILTGIGILGTFSGLIMGLTEFDVSGTPAQAQEQLRNLVVAVGHAFVVSASAIALAMGFTWVEKSLTTRCYRSVERLRELVDSMFKAGAGEEYLERLVVASETSATQAAHIKESLVTELKEILTELTNRQIQAIGNQAGDIGIKVGGVISEQLGALIKDLSSAVKLVSGSQSDAVTKMLTDVLASFSAQMRDMFGDQMHGLADLLQKSSESMQSTAIQLTQLVKNIDIAGSSAVAAMAERLNRALELSEERQRVLNDQMSQFVQQIKKMVEQSQTEQSKKLQEILGQLGTQMNSILAELQRRIDKADERGRIREGKFDAEAVKTINGLGELIQKLLVQSQATEVAIKNSVEQLTQTTTQAITGMTTGAETLRVAARDFALAGQGVTNVMESSGAAADSLKVATTQMGQSMDSARKVLDDYAKTRDTFSLMVSELKSTVENAKRDASMTSELIGRLESAAEQLSIAKEKSESYLHGVTEVLVSSHDAFAANMERTLREGNRKFQDELASAVQLLSGAIKNLGDLVDDLPAKR